jgi:ribokinase
LLTPNETETATLVGSAVANSPELAADCLLRKGVRNVALKLGHNGAYVKGVDVSGTYVAAFQTNVVDTTAAGDAFNAAFAVSLLKGLSPQKAATYANAAAAVAVSRLGAQPSLPSAAEVESFLRVCHNSGNVPVATH